MPWLRVRQIAVLNHIGGPVFSIYAAFIEEAKIAQRLESSTFAKLDLRQSRISQTHLALGL